MSPELRRLLREALVLVLLAASAAGAWLPGRPRESSPGPELSRLVPDRFGDWSFVPRPESADRLSLEFADEVHTAVYQRTDGRAVILTLERSGDFRRRNELHIPEYCHRQRGDAVELLPRLTFQTAAAQSQEALLMEWRYPAQEKEAVCAFWLVVDENPTADLFDLKVRQFVAGILNEPKEIVLVRIDAFRRKEAAGSEREERIALIRSFIHDLAEGVGPEVRAVLFGADAPAPN